MGKGYYVGPFERCYFHCDTAAVEALLVSAIAGQHHITMAIIRHNVGPRVVGRGK